MKRLIYGSQATYDLGPEELVDLLDVARRHNHQAGLTGMLLYCSQSFLQVLEGDSAPLAETYQQIESDPRHRNLRLLMDTDVTMRLFPDWSMGFDHLEDDQLAAHLPGYTPTAVYPLVNPDLIVDGRVAETLARVYAAAKGG